MANRLISFKLCPFVQRSVITLLEKEVAFDIEYIDLANKPQWFLDLSPLGKVPVLQVDDTVLFESAVINEYLDETTPPSLHPADPLQKARNRAWIEYGSALLGLQYGYSVAKDQDSVDKKLKQLEDKLDYLEGELGEGPFFNGAEFSLVDTAYAPFFMRMVLLEKLNPTGLIDGLPKIKVWSEALLAKNSVQKSVVDDFDDLFFAALEQWGSVLSA